MNKKIKIFVILFIAVMSSITAVYAVTIITSRDVIYDNSKSGGSSNNVQGAIDELYEKASNGDGTSSQNRNIIKYITALSKTDTVNLAYDDTEDKNLRYIGRNPNNYIEFNGELWRIIGIMNNVEDEKGNKASRVKIIRDESIGKFSFDNKPSGTGSSLSFYGSNDWSDAALMKMLNQGAYFNRTNGVCPYETASGVANRTISCDFSKIGLTETSKSMISKITWKLGGTKIVPNNSWETGAYFPKPSEFYKDERSNLTYSNGSTVRKDKWIGYVGLMYTSDYAYAIGGNTRDSCLNNNMNNFDNDSDWAHGDCKNNTWLYDAENSQRIMSSYQGNSYAVMGARKDGTIAGDYAFEISSIIPVVYLNTNINIASGTGEKTNPYIITDRQIFNDQSNASPPKIDENGKLVPVKLSDDGIVTYVSQDDEEWYNYSEKRWANAVILVDAPSTTYKIGDTIKESDIESYFVWIPKYKYKLWNTGVASKNAHEIEIIFDTKNTIDKEGESCATPMTSGSTGNCHNGEWMTHPAFISLGVDGFWVGKFETGYKGATTTAGAQVNSSDSSKIIIKPNVYSWRNNTVYNFFVSAYNYERTLESHMMKNTEWGAVAYLSHSKYGINAEVNVNNNSSYKTGYSALPSTNQQTYPGEIGDGASFNQPYNTSIGYLASTTGNITGIYDIKGGSYEYLAAYISGKPASSGFTTTTLSNYDAKYFDIYNSSSSIDSFQYRILGDATGEMGPFYERLDAVGVKRRVDSWYESSNTFFETSKPWSLRGAGNIDATQSSQFYFHGESGNVFDNVSSRLVIALR